MSVFNRFPRFGAHVVGGMGTIDVVAVPSTSLTQPPPLGPLTSYAEARASALTACKAVGVQLDDRYSDNLSVADLVMLAYATGSQAGEARLAAPDIADAIAGAIGTPSGILERNVGESPARHVVRAVQQVLAYGGPK